jgi:aspartyl-tRNA(Asn)/glutamyl-tRNA(Gln) amidotransferase subunit A
MAFAPRISGRALEAVARISRTRAGARLLYEVFRAEAGFADLERLPDHLLGDVPIDNRPLAGRAPRGGEDAAALALPLPSPPWSATTETLGRAYRTGETTPRQVVLAALDAARALAGRRPGFGPLLGSADEAALRDADASTERWRRGSPRGPLDGVPTAIKEQTAVRGLPVRDGSDAPIASSIPATEDATVVARLRAAGAIVLGQTPMTELGMSPLGFNPKRVMPRNPHAPEHLAGGSSTGAGVAVATGLVPFALGADGGGSIRIPAACCGVFGLKPTWGRISRGGDVSVGTVAHLGPLASSTVDLARVLEAVCGFDPADRQTELAPPLEAGSLVRALARGVRGLRIAVVESEWADAAPAVARAGREAMRALEREGAVLVDVRLELARWAAAIGYLAIGLEDMAQQRENLRKGAAYNADLAVSYAVLGETTATQYVHAQRLRAGLRREMARAFEGVDLFALPTTATTAVRVTDTEFEGGFVDARALGDMCRFAFLGNLTGLPAASAPVGLDEARLPIGFQLVGDAWDEGTVLAATAHLERLGVAHVARPRVTVEPWISAAAPLSSAGTPPAF